MAGMIEVKASDRTDVAVPERPVLDLSYRKFDHTVRGIRVIGTWLFAGERKEPCIVLLRPDVAIAKALPCVVPLSSAWRWTEEYGDQFHAATMAVGFAPALGLSPLSERDINRILDVVRHRLNDLLNMPPNPPRERRIAGDVTFTSRADGRETQMDIYDDV